MTSKSYNHNNNLIDQDIFFSPFYCSAHIPHPSKHMLAAALSCLAWVYMICLHAQPSRATPFRSFLIGVLLTAFHLCSGFCLKHKKVIPNKVCKNDCKEEIYTYNEQQYPNLPAVLCTSPYTQPMSCHLYTLYYVLLMIMSYLKHVLYEPDTYFCSC